MLRRHALLGVAVVALILSGSIHAYAQAPAVVNGKVEVKDSRKPVEGAVITFFMENSEKSVTMKSDKKGNFVKVGVRPGSYRARVEASGYHPLTVKGIELKNNDRYQIVLPLQPL